jgi:hypothetical protein
MSGSTLTVYVKAKQPYSAPSAFAAHLESLGHPVRLDLDEETTGESAARLTQNGRVALAWACVAS